MRRGWVVLAAVAALAGACSSDHRPENSLERLPGPGTDLGGGFVVPEATRLVGPAPGGQDWNVPLVLDGDPRDAADDVVNQARAAGLRLDAHCSVQPQRTFCSVRGLRHEGRWVLEEVYLQLERSSGGAPYRSGGILGHSSWAPGENEVGRGVEGLVDDPGPMPRPPLPPADDPPDLPDVGEPIADDDLLVGADLVLAEGSRIAVPVTPSGCATGGFHAHLIITGDVDAVVDDYEAQLAEHAPEVIRTESADAIRLDAHEIGGLSLSLDVQQGEPTLATLSGCND